MICSRVSALSGTVVSTAIGPSFVRSTPAMLMLPAVSSLAIGTVDDLVGDAADAFDPRGERGAMLHDAPVDDALQFQIRRRNGIRRHDEGADGATPVDILAKRPLPRAQRRRLQLRRATADIVGHRVAE